MKTWVKAKPWTRPRWWLERGVCAVAAALFLAYSVSWISPALSHWSGREGQRNLGREARRYGVTYSDAVSRPEWAVGKPVRWLVTRSASGEFHYGGQASLPILWVGPAPEMPAAGKHGYGEMVLGIVQEAGPRGVALSYQGRG